jgi:xanthine dehydrogenase accessory factor
LGAAEIAPLDFYTQRYLAGTPCALVTLLNIDGSAPRRVGTQIAVSPDSHCGSLSGGCLDAAVHMEARAALEAGRNSRLALGERSEIIDLRLPCGSTLLLQIDAALEPAVSEAIVNARKNRQPITLAWHDPAPGAQLLSAANTADFQHRYLPALKLCLVGAEPMLSIFLPFARAANVEATAYSPKLANSVTSDGLGILAWTDSLQGDRPGVMLDAYTAALTLLHEHEFELPFLSTALQSDAFWVGAMGSQKAHRARCAALAECGVAGQLIQALHGPVGMQGQSLAKTPELIALAILLEILTAYEQLY